MSAKKIPDFIENRLLEEYKELGLCWRHDDDWISKLSAVLLPLSIAALTLPYLRADIPKMLAVFGGLTLVMFWFLSSQTCKNRFEIRFSRIYQIEEILGFDSHLRYARERPKSAFKDQRLRLRLFIVYLFIACLVMCEIKVEATNPTVAHRIAQFIHAVTDTRVDPTFRTIDVWPPFGWWSADAWRIKLIITPEILVFLVIAVIFGYIGYRYYKRCNQVQILKTP